MKKSAHGKPIIIVGDETNLLEKVSPFSEKQIQDLVFENPLCLPISDIDESYNPVLPVCKELRTGAGDIDILMVTPNGDLLIVETKLWKNPGSRREVVGQVLDYAKELSMWSYSDLEREINQIDDIYKENNNNYKYVFSTQASRLLKIYMDSREAHSAIIHGKKIVGSNYKECEAKIE